MGTFAVSIALLLAGDGAVITDNDSSSQTIQLVEDHDHEYVDGVVELECGASASLLLDWTEFCRLMPIGHCDVNDAHFRNEAEQTILEQFECLDEHCPTFELCHKEMVSGVYLADVGTKGRPQLTEDASGEPVWVQLCCFTIVGNPVVRCDDECTPFWDPQFRE